MRDRLQGLANNFSSKFGLKPVNIPFTEALNHADVRIYNYLFAPSNVESAEAKHYAEEQIKKFNQLVQYEGYATAKDLLWKVAKKTPGFTSEITKSSVKILCAAIEICDFGKTKQKLSRAEHDVAIETANRIKKFHSGAMQLFRDLLTTISKNSGKMPLISDASLEEKYIHEFIHYVLYANKIVVSDQRFNEGLCTYLHLRFRGHNAEKDYQPPSMAANYLIWVPFFKKVLDTIPDHQIGRTLKSNLAKFLSLFEQGFRT